MANIRQLKRRIKSAHNTSKITKAMEMVAASKMVRAQTQALEARPYSEALYNSLRTIANFTDPSAHPLLYPHNSGKEMLVILSTEKGLCGSLNTNLMKHTLEWLRLHPQGQVIPVGKKAVTFCRIIGAEIFAQFTDLPEQSTISDVLPVTSLLMENFLSHEFKAVYVIYTNFVNTLSQYIDQRQLLPVTGSSPYDTDESAQTAAPVPEITSEYTFEPSTKDVLNQLLPLYIEQTMFHLVLEARASEHSARMVAMKNASENADVLVDELKLLFNKSRQASITAELLDIVTATLTLS